MTDVLMRKDYVEKIKKLADLKDQGILTEEEFASEKKKVFNEKSKAEEDEQNISYIEATTWLKRWVIPSWGGKGGMMSREAIGYRLTHPSFKVLTLLILIVTSKSCL